MVAKSHEPPNRKTLTSQTSGKNSSNNPTREPKQVTTTELFLHAPKNLQRGHRGYIGIYRDMQYVLPDPRFSDLWESKRAEALGFGG